MGKHSKNAGTMGSENLTYHERKALGFGTVSERLGKDSLGNFYDCNITLREAQDPVATPDGRLYSREAILENLLVQKRSIKRKVREWEAATAEETSRRLEGEAVEAEAAALAAERAEQGGLGDRAAERLRREIVEGASAERDRARGGAGGGPRAYGRATASSSIRDVEERKRDLKAFWVPSQAPEAETKLEKPSEVTRCPATGKPLKLRDLVDVHLHKAPAAPTGTSAEASAAPRAERGGESGPSFVDPVTGDVLTNSSRLVIVRPTGDVVLKETFDTCLLPDGEYRGRKITAEDAIPLQRGGTGYAAHDQGAQARKRFLLGPGSGLADRRGQGVGGGSKFGLRMG